MAIWANYQRIFYQSGILDFRYFPTLPLIYVLQLASYAPYALMTNLGFHDTLLFYHTTYVVEGVFLKLPMVLADVGVFILLARYTKILYATFYYINPFTIYISAAWGTYDSVMIFFIVAGFIALNRDRKQLATMSFCVAGLVKLFGFIPLALVLAESLTHRRFKDLLSQIAIAGSLGAATLAPIVAQGGLQNFLSGFLLRFLGLSGGQTRTLNIFASIQGTTFGGAPPYIWLAYAAVPVVFLIQRRKTTSVLIPVLEASIIAAILLNIFSQAEPQWLSWPIPLALMYAYSTTREGLAYYTYTFGTVAAFLAMTLTQGSGYLLFGLLSSFYLGALEGFNGFRAVYAITTLCLFVLMAAYVIAKPVKFRLEVLGLILIVYAQAYFWFSIVGIQNL